MMVSTLLVTARLAGAPAGTAMLLPCICCSLAYAWMSPWGSAADVAAVSAAWQASAVSESSCSSSAGAVASVAPGCSRCGTSSCAALHKGAAGKTSHLHPDLATRHEPAALEL
jgi:hypothetical protein